MYGILSVVEKRPLFGNSPHSDIHGHHPCPFQENQNTFQENQENHENQENSSRKS